MRMSRLLPLAPMPDDSSTEREGWLAAFGDRQLAIRAYDSDPLVLKGLPLGAAGVLVPLLSGLPEAVKQVSVPVLVMHGKEDSRAPWRQSVEQHQRLASEDKELRLFEGMRHQLLQVGCQLAVALLAATAVAAVCYGHVPWRGCGKVCAGTVRAACLCIV